MEQDNGRDLVLCIKDSKPERFQIITIDTLKWIPIRGSFGLDEGALSDALHKRGYAEEEIKQFIMVAREHGV